MGSFARNNLEAYLAVSDYHRKTGIKLNACISMLNGLSAGSGSWRKQFKEAARKRNVVLKRVDEKKDRARAQVPPPRA
jgi:hypothetical protein